MANYVYSVLAVSGPAEDIQKIKQLLEWNGNYDDDPKKPGCHIPLYFAHIAQPKSHSNADEKEAWGASQGCYGTRIVRESPTQILYFYSTHWNIPRLLLEKASRLFSELDFINASKEETDFENRTDIDFYKNGELLNLSEPETENFRQLFFDEDFFDEDEAFAKAVDVSNKRLDTSAQATLKHFARHKKAWLSFYRKLFNVNRTDATNT